MRRYFQVRIYQPKRVGVCDNPPLDSYDLGVEGTPERYCFTAMMECLPEKDDCHYLALPGGSTIQFTNGKARNWPLAGQTATIIGEIDKEVFASWENRYERIQ